MAKVNCDRCSETATRCYCDGCYEDKLETAADEALVGYTPDDDIPDVNATALREWLTAEKYKPSAPLSAETVAAFERCIEDLEAQHGR